MTLRTMLAQRVRRGALWGAHGFPYRCGVTPAEFTLWALAEDGRLNASLKSAGTVGTILGRFCADCPAQRRREAGDLCVGPVLEAYKGGGRPPGNVARADRSDPVTLTA